MCQGVLLKILILFYGSWYHVRKDRFQNLGDAFFILDEKGHRIMWDLFIISYILCLRWEISSSPFDTQTMGSSLIGSTWDYLLIWRLPPTTASWEHIALDEESGLSLQLHPITGGLSSHNTNTPSAYKKPNKLFHQQETIIRSKL